MILSPSRKNSATLPQRSIHLRKWKFQHSATEVSRQHEPAHQLFPWVHITLANLKRFLLEAHHAVEGKHLPGYVAEFNYRLNRRTMEPDLLQRLLRATIQTQTITYKRRIATPELTG